MRFYCSLILTFPLMVLSSICCLFSHLETVFFPHKPLVTSESLMNDNVSIRHRILLSLLLSFPLLVMKSPLEGISAASPTNFLAPSAVKSLISFWSSSARPKN